MTIKKILIKGINRNNYLQSFYTLIKLFSKSRNGLYAKHNIEQKFAKDIIEYTWNKENQSKIQSMMDELDDEGKKVIEEALEIHNYIYSNNILERDKVRKYCSNDYFNNPNKDDILPINHYETTTFKYHNGLKLLPKHVLQQLDKTNFIDAGAYIGDSALVFEQYYNPNRIYSFEPDIENYNYIKQTIRLNRLHKVIPIKKGVGDYFTTLRLKLEQQASHIDDNGEQSICVTTIDDYSKENKISNIGLIKMDIEGYELKALKGSRKTIKKDKPILLIAIYHTGEEMFESLQYIKDIEPDYKFIVRKLEPTHSIYEIILIAWCDK